MRKDRVGALARARAAGVVGFMLAGVDPDDWRAQVELRRDHTDCLLSFGLHPQLLAEIDTAEANRMFETLQRAVQGRGNWPRPGALGEIGLDRATPARALTMDLQEDLFTRQIALARQEDLPVMLHILKAHGRALEILGSEELPAAGGVVHSYSGSAELVPRYLDLGLHISFSGLICQPNAKRARAAIAAVPLDRLLLETDAPDQTPMPHQPGLNEPAFLPTIVDEAARLRGASFESIAAATTANARHLFGAA